MAKEQQEVDLMFLFDRIKGFYHSLLASFYRAVQFVFKYWIILLILLVGGYFLGKFWQDSVGKKRDAIILVQNNFGSTNYVYDAVELLNIKTRQYDMGFLKRNGFDSDNREILEVVIEPIVNLKDLLDQSEPNDRNIDFYMTELTVEDDLMESEIFYPQYRYHKITLTTNTRDEKIIQQFINYLNSTEQFNEIKDTMIAETKLRIERNNYSIKKIDEILQEFSKPRENQTQSGSQVYFNTYENNNIHMLFEKKIEIMDENEDLKTELTKFDSVVAVMNNPHLYEKSKLIDKKQLLVPFALVFLFISFFVVRSGYRKGKKYSTENE